MKADGHVHTPFCPHGTKDAFEDYIAQARQLGFDEISFTEHAPLPTRFVDPTPQMDSGMDPNKLENYFTVLTELQKRFASEIKINIGLEVDFIEGYEVDTKAFLNEYGRYLNDSILSVHFLKRENQYYCLDYSPDVFETMVRDFSSVEAVYEAYFHTLLNSVTSDLGPYKPKRIGHMTLVHKFQKKFPASKSFTDRTNTILDMIAEQGLSLDYNGAGINKPLCREVYPYEQIIKEAIKRKIPLVYGSDAHSRKDLNQGFNDLYKGAVLVSPTTY
ncbi:histidinol-phosphatase HisJ [Bacillus timonensis]|uniref:Histidinol-phosphatase n=1 Tax=Bacillus timonensis TaxID=1033734 RepID=A0A4S3PYZ4_9BACI|nr:histidinol-phosphatase HisJ [Bacillus timonensis]THE14776.1 histidinol-phosphatase HisJ [Bacillus timonensis]